MKLYLDTCSIQRPLDTPNQLRIRLEAEAILEVITHCNLGKLDLISSEMLEHEAERNPLAVRQTHAEAILEKASVYVEVTDAVEQRAQSFIKRGIKLVDALHIALAEAGEADYFCTCDDRFLNKLKAIRGLKAKAVSPLELVQELGI